ncbi:alpha/beta hydrolase [Kaarinaea lacus]
MANILSGSIRHVTIFICMYLLSIAVCMAEKVVSEKLADGKTVTAEFRPSEPGAPVVLILHGFLQTRNYLTVSNLADSASESGYAVLLPTLSLGVSERKKSLQCDAVHTHSFKEDIEEIDFWIKWLKKKGHKEITLIGHSFGSLQLLGYLLDYSDKDVSQLIATSLLDISREIKAETLKSYIDDARSRISKGDKSLREYGISYCKKYLSPADAYMSYMSWSRASILDSVKSIKVPVTVILGSKDKRLDKDWKDELRAHGAKVIMIKEANHFFSADQEFDLLDTVQKLLQ